MCKYYVCVSKAETPISMKGQTYVARDRMLVVVCITGMCHVINDISFRIIAFSSILY